MGRAGALEGGTCRRRAAQAVRAVNLELVRVVSKNALESASSALGEPAGRPMKKHVDDVVEWLVFLVLRRGGGRAVAGGANLSRIGWIGTRGRLRLPSEDLFRKFRAAWRKGNAERETLGRV